METLDPNTSAAVPGRLVPTRRRFARYFGRGPMEQCGLYVGSFLPTTVAPSAFGLRKAARRWVATCEHLEYGCLGPSLVVDGPRGRVATFTNLNARGERSFPAVRIIDEPLHLLPRELAEEGARLASACIYFGSAESSAAGYWEDFLPMLVDCLVEDRSACAGARARLKKLAWTALMMGVADLKGKYDCGLYRVNVPHEVTWNSA